MKRLGLLFIIMAMVLGCVTAVYAGKNNTKGITVTPIGEADIWTDRGEYRVGDPVRISFKSTVDGYAAIYDYSPDGRSQMIWPRNGAPAYIRAGKVYTAPDGNYNINASEPVGRETLVLVVSRVKTTFSVNINLNMIFSGRSKGLNTDGTGNVIANTDDSGDSISAQCSFNVLPKYTKPVVRINGGSGARIFVDGHDYNTVAPTSLTLEPGYHQVVALLPGMRVEYKDFNLKANTTYDWGLKFRPAR